MSDPSNLTLNSVILSKYLTSPDISRFFPLVTVAPEDGDVNSTIGALSGPKGRGQAPDAGSAKRYLEPSPESRYVS